MWIMKTNAIMTRMPWSKRPPGVPYHLGATWEPQEEIEDSREMYQFSYMLLKNIIIWKELF